MLTTNGLITIGKVATATLAFSLIGSMVVNHHPHHPNIQINEEYYDKIRKSYKQTYGESKSAVAAPKPVVAKEHTIRQ